MPDNVDIAIQFLSKIEETLKANKPMDIYIFDKLNTFKNFTYEDYLKGFKKNEHL